MKKTLAVLIPTFNGGKLLLESIQSCCRAGLDPDDYQIIVVDNCSTDGSVEKLPPCDSANANIRVVHNDRNLGRVGNWNRALETAQQEFEFAIFLFVGDQWMPGKGLMELLSFMRQTGAVMGMGPVVITREDGAVLRHGRRVSIRPGIGAVEGDELLRKVLDVGHVPFAPIQANVYRMFEDKPLHFPVGNELTGDLQGTLQFLADHRGPVIVTSSPFFAWRRHRNRFFLSANVLDTLVSNTRVLEECSSSTQLPVNWRSANAVLLLSSSHGPLFLPIPWRQRIAIVRDVLRYIGSRPGGIGWRDLVLMLYRKLVWKQSFVSL